MSWSQNLLSFFRGLTSVWPGKGPNCTTAWRRSELTHLIQAFSTTNCSSNTGLRVAKICFSSHMECSCAATDTTWSLLQLSIRTLSTQKCSDSTLKCLRITSRRQLTARALKTLSLLVFLVRIRAQASCQEALHRASCTTTSKVFRI